VDAGTSGTPDAGTAGDGGIGTGAGQDGGGAGSGDQDAGVGAGGSGSGGGGGGSGGGGGGSGGGGQDGGTGVGAGPAALTGPEEAQALALDAVNVYWINDSGAPDPSRWVVRVLPKSGGTPRTLAAGEGNVDDLVADDEAVFVTVRTCTSLTCSGSTDTVVRVSKADGSSTTLTSGTGQLALDDGWVYYLVVRDNGSGEVRRQPKRGGPSQVLASEKLYPPAIAVFGDTVYWIGTDDRDEQSHGVIRAAPKDGGTARTLAGGSFVRMKADFNFLYLRSSGDGSVYRVGRSGQDGKPIRSVKGSFLRRDDIDAHSGVVYWNESASDQHPGCLGRANADGSDVRCLDEGNFKLQAVRVDDDAVYYLKDRRIWKVGK
jgi:hypothetical protein